MSIQTTVTKAVVPLGFVFITDTAIFSNKTVQSFDVNLFVAAVASYLSSNGIHFEAIVVDTVTPIKSRRDTTAICVNFYIVVTEADAFSAVIVITDEKCQNELSRALQTPVTLTPPQVQYAISPSSTPSSTSSGVGTGLIVGIAVVGGLVVIIMAAVAKRWRSKKIHEHKGKLYRKSKVIPDRDGKYSRSEGVGCEGRHFVNEVYDSLSPPCFDEEWPYADAVGAHNYLRKDAHINPMPLNIASLRKKSLDGLSSDSDDQTGVPGELDCQYDFLPVKWGGEIEIPDYSGPSFSIPSSTASTYENVYSVLGGEIEIPDYSGQPFSIPSSTAPTDENVYSVLLALSGPTDDVCSQDCYQHRHFMSVVDSEESEVES